MNDDVLKYIKKTIKENRVRMINESFDPEVKQLLEIGDEFGDVMGDVGWSDFAKILGDPGKVKNAIMGSLGKVAAKSQSLASVIIKGIPSLIIPFVSTHYENIYTKEDARLRALRAKYPDAFKSASEIFNSDAKLAAFMINPVLMLTGAALSASTEGVMALAKGLSLRDHEMLRQLKQIWRHVNRMPGTAKRIASKKDKDNDDLYYESVILEASSAQKTLSAFLNSPKIKQRLMSSEIVQEIQSVAEEIMNDSLHDIIDLSSMIRDVNSIEDITKLDSSAGSKLSSELDKVEEKDRSTVSETIVQTFKNDAQKAIIEKQKLAMKELSLSGVPDNADIIKAYSRVLEKISSS